MTRINNITETLLKFKNLEIDKTLLKKEIGDDLYNVDCPKPLVITKEDLCKVIQCYINNDIPLQQLVDWVNVIWFTDLYVFVEAEADSIISVLEILETMDEDDVIISESEFKDMITALASNTEYISK